MFGKKRQQSVPAQTINLVPAGPSTSLSRTSQALSAVPALGENTDFSARLRRAASNPLKSVAGPAASHQSHGLNETLRAIETTFYLIDMIRDVVIEACHIVLRANTVDDLAGRSLLAEQYDEMRQSIARLIESADEDARRLVGPQAEGLVSRLGQHSSYTVFPSPLDLSESGLDLPPPHQDFADITEIADILGKLDQALDKLDSVSAFYMKDAKYLMSKLGG